MTANYDDVLAQLQGAGLQPAEPLEVGRLRRCRVEDKRHGTPGWYVLHEMRLDNGNDVLVGSFGVWSGNDEGSQKIALRKTDLSSEQRASLRERIKEDRRKAEAARKAVAKRAARRASKAWSVCVEQGDHEYLRKKGVSAHGVRFSPQGALVIPVLDVAARMQSVQVIRAPGSRGPGKQFWPAGASVKGCMHMIGMAAPGSTLVVAEGYATAATLHEATGLPVAVAFNANNLAPVARALHKRHKTARILICADDDTTQRCRQCKARVWLPDGNVCPHCGEEHGAGNAGITSASAAALGWDGAWLAPVFTNEVARRAQWMERGGKQNDSNDLHQGEGLHVVRAQVEARLLALGWRAQARRGAGTSQGERGGPDDEIRPFDDIEELLERFSLVYGHGGALFDHREHILLKLDDMRDACQSRELHRAWHEHPDRKIVRVRQVGFDPSEEDPDIRCNLWAGWPTAPQSGNCDALLGLLQYMCGEESHSGQLYQWVLKWLAYPLQNPGAKMKTAIVIHGPQGTGKNMFFEAYMAIYGQYGRVIDQTALEDRFNDWASRKLFLIADEVVARSDLYHVKNKLKAFITGDWIRINPKNIQAYDERNHVNLVFLSNEAMPVVLEEDDRRHAIVWTPEKLGNDFYAEVRREIKNGGIAALHDYLLRIDLGDFNAGSLPPMTEAKRELIDLTKDSPSQFEHAFVRGDIDGFPARNTQQLLMPALSGDIYELYVHWCREVNMRALNHPRFVNALMRKHKAEVSRKRYVDNAGRTKGPVALINLPGGQEMPPGRTEIEWTTERVDAFKLALRDYKNRGIAA